MKKLALILVLPFLISTGIEILPVLPDPTPVAEAARLGGGRSIGSRPSFNRPTQAPTRQPGSPAAPGAPGMARGGFLGGMFGPLLAGSLLGALLFGGAFSGLGGADLIIILLGVWLVFRFLRNRRAAPATPGNRQASPQYNDSYSDAWSNLRSAPGQTGPQSSASPGFRPPAGFDEAKFMEGARMIYTRMQESWDKRDLEDIRQFTTPGMFRLIEEQAKEDPTPSTTTVLTMTAQPHDFRIEGNEELISVYFDALVREYADRDAENTREIWHFARPVGQGTWKLDGIQQAE